MNRPLYPTPIEAARRCWRRYAGRYLFRIKTEQSNRFERGLGDEVHDLSERWNKMRQAPVPDRSVADNLFIAGLPYLPPPRAGATEDESTITLNGITYAMRRDWKGALSELPGGETPVSLQTYGDMPAQLDLKTASQPFKFGLWTREKFLDDTQAVLMGVELAESTGSDVVASRWLYFAKPKKEKDGTYKIKTKVEAFPSDIVLGRDALGRAHLRIIEPVAKGILELQEAHARGAIRDFREPNANLGACMDYGYVNREGVKVGGCEFRALCEGTIDAGQVAALGYSAAQNTISPQSAAVGENGNMANGSLFQQFQNGQAPAPVMGAPAAPAFAPPPMPAGAVLSPGNPAFIQNPNGSYSPVSQFAPAPQQAPAQAPAFTPPAAPPQAPAFAPAPAQAPFVNQGQVQQVQTAPAQVFAPPVQAQPPAPFPGFTGVNAPEIRALDQAKAPAPIEALRAALPTEAEALAALKVLRVFLSV